MVARRDFVKGGVALVSIGTTSNSLLKGALAFAAENPRDALPAQTGKTLVLVQLAGGNDGLNTLVPMDDGAYRSARPTIGVPEAEALPLQDGYGFAPQLAGLKGLWDEGRLALIRGIGYPNQNYSHFKSMAIWEAGDPEMKLKEGWLGRTLEGIESQAHDPFFGFNVGSSTPPELRSDTISIPSSDASLLGSGNFESDLVERVPADAFLFLNGMDLGANPLVKAATLALAQAINGEEPGVVPEGVSLDEYAAQQFEGAAALLGFNLDTDLVEQLSGEFAVFLSVTNLLSPDGISGVIVSGVM